MAAVKAFNTTAVTGDLTLGNAGEADVCRWIVHITAISGTYIAKGKIRGSADTAVVVTAVKRADGTTVTSITATGIYDIDAAGLDISLTGGTSCTITAIPVQG